MQITDVTVTVERTESLPGYRNFRRGIQLKASLDEGEEIETAVEALHTQARELVDAQVNARIEINAQIDVPF